MAVEKLKGNLRKRTTRRELGLFIDGTGLDRATRRLKRKVDLPALVKGVSSGLSPIVARYYTIVPYEDDSRQHAFLDAVRRAGLRVVVKRLPPKGITRQVAIDVEMASDIVAFALGHKNFSALSEYDQGSFTSASGERRELEKKVGQALPLGKLRSAPEHDKGSSDSRKRRESTEASTGGESSGKKIERIITVVCPSRDLAYPISLAKDLSVDTVSADFGQFNAGDVLKNAAKWIDLSDSETIWRD